MVRSICRYLDVTRSIRAAVCIEGSVGRTRRAYVAEGVVLSVRRH